MEGVAARKKTSTTNHGQLKIRQSASAHVVSKCELEVGGSTNRMHWDVAVAVVVDLDELAYR